MDRNWDLGYFDFQYNYSVSELPSMLHSLVLPNNRITPYQILHHNFFR